MSISKSGSDTPLGDNPEAYRNSYQLQSPEDPAAWTALIRLCKTLNQTAPGELRDQQRARPWAENVHSLQALQVVRGHLGDGRKEEVEERALFVEQCLN